MAKQIKCTSNEKKKAFEPQNHQLRVMEEFLISNKRGLLFFHALGSGKTCSAYMAIDAYIKKFGKKNVFILSPASLANNHRDQYCDFCGDNNANFNSFFRFYSYNDRAGIVKKLDFPLDDSIILVDEVQEIINGRYNNSNTLVHVYNKILEAKRAKVILLSGTPIYNEFGLSLILNLLDPGCLPLEEGAFMELLSNKDYIYSKMKGLISYVPVPNKELYPTRINPDIVYRIPMSRHQYTQYVIVREDELEMKRRDQEQLNKLKNRNPKAYQIAKAMEFLRLIKLKSRGVCNFAYPDDIQVDINEKRYKTDKDAGWVINDDSFQHIDNLVMYSPKFAKLIKNLLVIPDKHAVYLWLKTLRGIYIIQSYLKYCGIESLVFSGDATDDQRSEILRKFNADDNIRGEKYKVILISGAGSVGISILGVKHFHIPEAGTNEFIVEQAEGRVFRVMSLHQLPPEERQIQVYRYFTIMPEFSTFIEEKSSEEITYENGMKKKVNVFEILKMMRNASFDCREGYNSGTREECYNFPEDRQEEESANDFDFEGSAF